MDVQLLLERHAERWDAAIAHPFLVGVRDGTLPVAALDTWLVQDALFVQDLLGFQTRLVARSPEAAEPVLSGGVDALAAELDWFGDLAAERGLDLGAPPLPSTLAYAALLARLDGEPYPIAITALWALERVYLEGWRGAAPGAPQFRPLVEHWTAPGFAGYVGALQGLVEQAGSSAAAADLDVDDVLVAVLDQDRAFWDMAMA